MRLNDAVVGVALMLGAALLLWHVSGYPAAPHQAYGPAFFPAILGVGLLVCGALLVAGGVRAGGAVVAFGAWVRSATAWRRFLGLPLAVAAMMAAWNSVGFPLAGFAVTFALLLDYGGGRPVRAALIAGGAVAVVWALFVELLLVPLPAGWLAGVL